MTSGRRWFWAWEKQTGLVVETWYLGFFYLTRWEDERLWRWGGWNRG